MCVGGEMGKTLIDVKTIQVGHTMWHWWLVSLRGRSETHPAGTPTASR